MPLVPPYKSWPTGAVVVPVPPLPIPSAEARVKAPALLKDEVAVPPKYAFWKTEARDEDARVKVARPVSI
jgi:hypothetical protein